MEESPERQEKRHGPPRSLAAAHRREPVGPGATPFVHEGPDMGTAPGESWVQVRFAGTPRPPLSSPPPLHLLSISSSAQADLSTVVVDNFVHNPWTPAGALSACPKLRHLATRRIFVSP